MENDLRFSLGQSQFNLRSHGVTHVLLMEESRVPIKKEKLEATLVPRQNRILISQEEQGLPGLEPTNPGFKG